MEYLFLSHNRVRPISQCGGLERGGLERGGVNNGMDTGGFCALMDVCNMRQNIQNGGNIQPL